MNIRNNNVKRFLLMSLVIFVTVSFLLPSNRVKGSAQYIYLDSLEPSEMEHYDGNEGDSFVYAIGKHKYSRGNKDVNGNKYEHGIEAWIARWNCIAESSWAYSVYKVDNKYKNLSGKVVLIDSYNTTNFDTTLYFYGDGKLIKEYKMTPTSFPFDIDVGLTGVNELKIYVKDNMEVKGGISFGIVDCKMKTAREVHEINKARVILDKKEYYYTGKVIKPLPKIIYNNKCLTKGKDYTLTYKKNKEIGTATIVIKGKGSYYGKKEFTFKIVKQPQFYLSANNLSLCLVNKRSAKLTVHKGNVSGKVKWKSSNKNIVSVDKNGKLKAISRGIAIITASINKTQIKCKVNVADVATVVSVYDDFDSFDSWSKNVRKKESELVFGGGLVPTADGKTYYTGNIIVEREVLSYKVIEARVSDMKPGYYKTVKYSLPKKVKYKLHRHNLSPYATSEKIEKLVVGLVEGNFVWSQHCSCGLESTLSWTIPKLPQKINGEDVYIVDSISSY